jgi:hypothetical protein
VPAAQRSLSKRVGLPGEVLGAQDRKATLHVKKVLLDVQIIFQESSKRIT